MFLNRHSTTQQIPSCHGCL